jgi:hypothetical protein
MTHATVSFTTKLGTTRAGERTRIWIEGKRLVDHGFTVGKRFTRMWHKGALTIIVCSETVFAKHAVSERGTVSGKGEKPIIDITGAKVAATFTGTHVDVAYSKGTIVITNKA